MTYKHFADCGADIVRLPAVSWADTRDFTPTIGRSLEVGEKLVREGHLFAYGICPQCGRRHPSRRRIYYAQKPSMHVCNAKCMGATGPDCECSCGGKNHGAGFVLSGSLF